MRALCEKAVNDNLYWNDPKNSMLLLKILLLVWPFIYITLVYLPIRFGIAILWIAFFIWLSDFGSKLCTACVKCIKIRIEDWQASMTSSLQVAEEESARPSPVSIIKTKQF